VTTAIDPLEFRSVLGHFATGVTVVTGQAGDQPVGLAANAFTSVSLDPPLVLVCPARISETWPLIRASGAFAVNFLAEHQEELSRRFGARGIDRFADAGWHTRTTGSPVLPDALAYVDCLIEAEHEAGDHQIVVGRVVELGRLAEGRPLIFWRGSYGRLAD
jgi:3-hydroxy-9,10-secoandrosta-1,3,5(10)-triene-9,17-dione monooxygenase reductase component